MKRSIEKFLNAWKNEKNRSPLILRGPRQVGKSFIIEKFGKGQFQSLVIANFEFNTKLAECFQDLDPQKICARLEVILNTTITAGETLLFLDEIQICPQAILALRYFKEKMKDLHVIAAGSLLEFVLHEEAFSFPVGRVEFIYLRPLSFHEYLIAQDHKQLIEKLEEITINSPLESVIHNHLLSIVKEYFLVGGMPAAVSSFLENKSYLSCSRVLASLLQTYQADFSKYAKKAQHKYLQLFFEKAPQLIAKHFKYSHISTDVRSRELKVALKQLEWAGLLKSIYVTNASGLPLQAHLNENVFKLLFLDIGLMNRANNIDLQEALTKDIDFLTAGAQAEQFVGQELVAYQEVYENQPLFYWSRDKKGSAAEVDFVVQINSEIIPIEVKAGTTGSLKSLTQFMDEKKSRLGVRISSHPLSYHNKILSVPFYLIQQLPRLVKEILA